eukprot:TRINITY_DN4111_c2_g1_i3.p1 TRINITY_DN4111_c2_g1~~TRINITY_DN4111_c2_g1_i3.p1  ORF type:complete len:303 (-),score=51.56 TRINITY_DN4111_c2_g1_i3:116-1024(-)
MEIPKEVNLPPLSNLLQYLEKNEFNSDLSPPAQTQEKPILAQTSRVISTPISNTNTLFPSSPSLLYSAPSLSHSQLAFSAYPLIFQYQSSGGPPQSTLPTLNNSSSYETLANPSTPTKCLLTDCLLCKKGPPGNIARSPTWVSMLRVVLFTLSSNKENASKEYFSLKDDVYDFIVAHWPLLCGSKTYKGRSWHKQVQDILSHSKEVFESGVNKLGEKGYWKLKINQDPWKSHNILRGKSKSNTRTSSSLVRNASDSHVDACHAYKRGEKNKSREISDNSESEVEVLQKRRKFTESTKSETFE